jgi:hypothetical protein
MHRRTILTLKGCLLGLEEGNVGERLGEQIGQSLPIRAVQPVGLDLAARRGIEDHGRDPILRDGHTQARARSVDDRREPITVERHGADVAGTALVEGQDRAVAGRRQARWVHEVAIEAPGDPYDASPLG